MKKVAAAPFHIARLFRNGGSQAVRLPAEFRFEGNEVRLRRIGSGVLIEPLRTDPDELFAAVDRLISSDFMTERGQPETPVRALFP